MAATLVDFVRMLHSQATMNIAFGFKESPQGKALYRAMCDSQVGYEPALDLQNKDLGLKYTSTSNTVFPLAVRLAWEEDVCDNAAEDAKVEQRFVFSL